MREIELVNGRGIALVDDEDYERLSQHRWFYHHHGYAVRNDYSNGHKNGKTIFMHHDVIGRPSNGLEVDHINRNGLDNQKRNLRIATRGQNTQNTLREKRTATASRFRGVTRDVRTGRWRAQLFVNKKHMLHLSFTDEVEAAHAYDSAVRHFFGEFAIVNFPGDVRPFVPPPPHKQTSRFRGVSLDRPGKWRARLYRGSRTLYSETFASEVEAARAYDVAARKHFGESAVLNFPDE